MDGLLATWRGAPFVEGFLAVEAFALTPFAPPLRACGDLEAELRPPPPPLPTLDQVGPDGLLDFFAEVVDIVAYLDPLGQSCPHQNLCLGARLL